MVKTSPSNVGGVGLTTDWRAKIPHASQPKRKTEAKKKKRSNIITDSIKTFKKWSTSKKEDLPNMGLAKKFVRISQLYLIEKPDEFIGQPSLAKIDSLPALISGFLVALIH